MQPTRPILIAVCLAALAFAGCIGAEDEPVDPSEAPTGTVEGQVVTNDLEEVPKAKVSLVDAAGKTVAETITDEEGRYVLTGIAPGKYKLQVDAFCCKLAVKTVEVKAGEALPASVQIMKSSAGELQVPTRVDREWHGFISCGVGVVVADMTGGTVGDRGLKAAACAIPGIFHESLADENEEFILYFNMSKGLKSVVLAMDWDPVGGVSGRTFNLLFENGTCEEVACTDAYTYADLDGGPALRAHVNAEDIDPEAEDALWENIEEEEEFKFRIFVGDGVAEAVYQQPFSIYWSEFYYEPAPEGFDPLPT